MTRPEIAWFAALFGSELFHAHVRITPRELSLARVLLPSAAVMAIGLSLAGANPDLYDGYPVEFNLNLEGALATILQAGIDSYEVPDRIAEQMARFAR